MNTYAEPTIEQITYAENLGYTVSDGYSGKHFKRDNCEVRWDSLDNAWASSHYWEQSNGGQFEACKHYYSCLEHALERKDIADQTNRTFATGKPYKAR